MGNHCKLSFLSPVPRFRVSSRASRTSTFHDIPKWRACSQAKTTSVRRFSALRASVWPKNEVVVVVVVGGGGGGRPPPPASPGSATGFVSSQLGTVLLFNKF